MRAALASLALCAHGFGRLRALPRRQRVRLDRRIATSRSPCSTRTWRRRNFIDTADTYMRPNMGISETIIGEWMAARGEPRLARHRDEGRLRRRAVRGEHRRARRRVARAACGPHRIDLYYAHKDDGSVAVEETVRAFDQTVRDGKVLNVAASNVPPDGSSSRWRSPDREGLAPYVWLQAEYNLMERAGYERDCAPIVAARGLAVAPYFALAAELSDRQVPQRRRPTARPARAWSPVPRRPARGAACWTRWTRSRSRAACRSAR